MTLVSFSGNMTSDILPSGWVASATSEGNPEKAYRAFDGDLSVTSYWFSSGTGTQFIRYQTPTGHIVKQYQIRTLDVSNVYYFNAWTMRVSNDGAMGTTLDTQSGVTMADNTTYTYNVTNSTSYTYHDLNVTRTGPSGGVTNHTMAMTEITFLETQAVVVGGAGAMGATGVGF